MRKILTLILILVAGLVHAQENGELRILAIGDSNGAIEGGWVDQLRIIRSSDTIINTCVSGNTIGFDNLGRHSLNTLRNIEDYMMQAKAVGGVDYILVLLGTNDCKAIFADSASLVPKNMMTLIKAIKGHEVYKLSPAPIIIVTPPPMGYDKDMLEKYHGGRERVEVLKKAFKKVARKQKCEYLDIHSKLLPDFDNTIKDGVHFKEEGQKIIASEMDKLISKMER